MPKTNWKTAIDDSGGAECGALSDDPQFLRLAELWPNLPIEARKKLVDLAETMLPTTMTMQAHEAAPVRSAADE